jgi:hypothetical protein
MRVRSMVLALMLVPVTAGAAELIPPGDLKSTFFDGKPIHSTTAKGRVGGEVVVTADGKVTRTGRRGPVTGTWRMSDDGFCMTLGQAKRESCYIAVRDGTAVTVIRAGAGSFTWTR